MCLELYLSSRKMLVFGLVFVFYYLKLSAGSGLSVFVTQNLHLGRCSHKNKSQAKQTSVAWLLVPLLSLYIRMRQIIEVFWTLSLIFLFCFFSAPNMANLGIVALEECLQTLMPENKSSKKKEIDWIGHQMEVRQKKGKYYLPFLCRAPT